MGRNNGLSQRNRKGQFITGHNGGPGRPRGSRNALGESFIADLHESWIKNGKGVIDFVVRNEPAKFLKIIASLMPKELNAELNMSVGLFHEIENVNTAYRLALDYLLGKIEANDEPALIEAGNGGE